MLILVIFGDLQAFYLYLGKIIKIHVKSTKFGINCIQFIGVLFGPPKMVKKDPFFDKNPVFGHFCETQFSQWEISDFTAGFSDFCQNQLHRPPFYPKARVSGIFLSNLQNPVFTSKKGQKQTTKMAIFRHFIEFSKNCQIYAKIAKNGQFSSIL